jgi:hypothetical protein
MLEGFPTKSQLIGSAIFVFAIIVLVNTFANHNPQFNKLASGF